MTEVAQPSGTVTLVFTDIEGSTHLLEELGTDAYREALAEHRRIVRAACGDRGGYEVDYEGDAFFYAFGSAQDAVAAVADTMRALRGGPIRLRVGVHTGEPGLDPPKYVGLDVHRAARIMAAAHGGQVVVSQSTAALLRPSGSEPQARPSGSEPQAPVLVDLGEHRFKDLAAPERVYQLGEGEFPPLRSLHRSNLPAPATPFLGRAAEVAEVTTRLTGASAPLLTLTGSGGTGKTRLALQAAAAASEAFPDGVWWVPLAPLRDPGLVLSGVAAVLDIQEEAGRDLAKTLAAQLGGKRMLLVLDNVEHLLPDAAMAVAAIRDIGLGAVMVTSRERLQLLGEEEYVVQTLDPADAFELMRARGAALGVTLEPSPVVSELLARLDRLPLAIELAAARLKLFTPEELLERLSRRLDLLTGARDADPRQQTLRATLDWSYQLLEPDEQRVFRALSVFAGGCALDAAEAVAGADAAILQSLLDKSLLRRRETPRGSRFSLLETVREFGSELCERAGEASRSRRHLADWALDWSGQGVVEPSAADLRDELPNVRSAFEELAASGRTCDRLRLAADVAQGMFQLGVARESRAILGAAISAAELCDRRDRGRALVYASIQASLTGDLVRARSHAAAAAELLTDEGRTRLRAEQLLAESLVHLNSGELTPAESATTAALEVAQAIGAQRLVADLRANLCHIATLNGDHALARHAAEAALVEARAVDPHATAVLLLNLAIVAILSDDVGLARVRLAEALELSRAYGFVNVLRFSVEGVAVLASRAHSYDLTARLLGATSSPQDTERGAPEEELVATAEADARAALGATPFDHLAAAGRSAGLEVAVEHASQWLASRRASTAEH